MYGYLVRNLIFATEYVNRIRFLSLLFILSLFRFETQHGALCAIGYITADCMSRTPTVSWMFVLLCYYVSFFILPHPPPSLSLFFFFWGGGGGGWVGLPLGKKIVFGTWRCCWVAMCVLFRWHTVDYYYGPF